MKITKASVYRVVLPCVDGPHTFAGGRGGDDVFHSVVLQLDTDAGITGYGEVRHTNIINPKLESITQLYH